MHSATAAKPATPRLRAGLLLVSIAVPPPSTPDRRHSNDNAKAPHRRTGAPTTGVPWRPATNLPASWAPWQARSPTRCTCRRNGRPEMGLRSVATGANHRQSLLPSQARGTPHASPGLISFPYKPLTAPSEKAHDFQVFARKALENCSIRAEALFAAIEAGIEIPTATLPSAVTPKRRDARVPPPGSSAPWCRTRSRRARPAATGRSAWDRCCLRCRRS